MESSGYEHWLDNTVKQHTYSNNNNNNNTISHNNVYVKREHNSTTDNDQQHHQQQHNNITDDSQRIRQLLERKLGGDEISFRLGPGGKQVSYLSGNKAIELANYIFNYNGWSSEIIKIDEDYMDVVNNKYNVGYTAIVRVTLHDGCYHEDIGYGSCSNINDKGSAIEKAKKEAITDAMKRALRLFGNGLGLTIYDRKYVEDVRTGKRQTEALDLTRPDTLSTQQINNQNKKIKYEPTYDNISYNNNDINNNNNGNNTTNPQQQSVQRTNSTPTPLSYNNTHQLQQQPQPYNQPVQPSITYTTTSSGTNIYRPPINTNTSSSNTSPGESNTNNSNNYNKKQQQSKPISNNQQQSNSAGKAPIMPINATSNTTTLQKSNQLNQQQNTNSYNTAQSINNQAQQQQRPPQSYTSNNVQQQHQQNQQPQPQPQPQRVTPPSFSPATVTTSSIQQQQSNTNNVSNPQNNTICISLSSTDNTSNLRIKQEHVNNNNKHNNNSNSEPMPPLAGLSPVNDEELMALTF